MRMIEVDVVIEFIVKPSVNTSAVIGGHMPTKQSVPRGRRSRTLAVHTITS